MGHAYPGQNQKALLVGQVGQVRLALGYRPTNKLIAHGYLPGCRAKDHHRQLPPPGIAGQILHVLSDRAVETAIMVLGQQLSHSPSQLGGMSQFQTHRLQRREVILDGRGGCGQ